MMASSRQLGLRVGIGDTNTLTKKKIPFPRNNTYTQEFRLRNNARIYRDKLLFCKPNIPHMTLSKTLDQESISDAEVSSPFWTRSLEDTYQKLWLPIETDLQDLDSICSNTYFAGSMCPSQYCQIQMSKTLQKNSPETSCQSLRFSQQEIMDQDPIKFCRKIRFYPNKEQLELFNKCIGGARFFYNKAVSVLKERGVSGLLQLRILRPLVMMSDKDIPKGHPMEWQKEIPYDTRQEAISDAIIAYKSALTNQRNGNIDHFNIQFKSKKNQVRSQSFRVNKLTLFPDDVSFFPGRLKDKKKIRMRTRDIKKFKEDGTVDGNFMIQKLRPDKWYLCLLRERSIPIFENAPYKSAFLDPGVRVFEALYSPDGICGKIKIKGLPPLAKKHDKLWSVSDKTENSKTKRNLRRRCAILRNKIKNKVDDLHWQTCSFLCNTFQNIFIPEFPVAQMVKGSPLGHAITRKMLQLSHGLFKTRLMYFAKTKQRNLYIVKENWTTKTCGRCGHIQDMGANKVYDCGACEASIDRDYNGARNICLKFVSKFI